MHFNRFSGVTNLHLRFEGMEGSAETTLWPIMDLFTIQMPTIGQFLTFRLVLEPENYCTALKKDELCTRNPCLMDSNTRKSSVGCDDLEIWSVFRIFIVTNGGRATARHIQPKQLNRNDASDFAISPWVTFDSGRYAPTILWESRMRYYPPFRQPRTKEALLNGAKISVLTATELFLTVIILGNRHASA